MYNNFETFDVAWKVEKLNKRVLPWLWETQKNRYSASFAKYKRPISRACEFFTKTGDVRRGGLGNIKLPEAKSL